MPPAADWTFVRDSHRGIPVFSDPEPHEEFTGVLMFRVGRSDEPPPRIGITHLVEHLALHRMTGAEFACNGNAGPIFTTFHATGTPGEVAGFLKEVARALHDLPLDRVRDEARILRVEALGYSIGLVQQALWYRCGNRGHGLGPMNELILHSPDPEVIRSWAAERFTAGNAALSFNGPPPADLDVTLPPGPARPAASVEPLAEVSWPACVQLAQPRVGLTMVGKRDAGLMAAQEVAVSRIQRALRDEQSLIYAVQHTYDVLNHDTALLGAWTDSLESHVVHVRDTILSTYAALAREGPSAEELKRFTDPAKFTFRRGEREMFLSNALVNTLLGSPVLDPADYLQEHAAVDVARVTTALSGLLDTALLSLPTGFGTPSGFIGYPYLSSSCVKGRVHRLKNARWPWQKSEELVVGAEGVSRILLNGGAHTVKYNECVAAVLHRNDVLTLVGEDGFTVEVDPRQWQYPFGLVEKVMNALPRERVVVVNRD